MGCVDLEFRKLADLRICVFQKVMFFKIVCFSVLHPVEEDEALPVGERAPEQAYRLGGWAPRILASSGEFLIN